MAEAGEEGRSVVQIKPLGIIAGILFGLGVAVLLQQYGVAPMTTGLLITWLIIGVIVGIALPTGAFMLARNRAQKGGGS